MADARLNGALRHVRTMAGRPPGDESDGDLLRRFAADADWAAFAAIVRRHGPLVLRVCRRVLGHEQDAEDAFQATFLVLAQSPHAIRKREALADWLHGVAHRTALKVKRGAARRRNREARRQALTSEATPSP